MNATKLSVSFLIVSVLILFIAFPAPAQAALEISTEYPGVTVTPGEDLSFMLNISNEGLGSQVVNLSISEKPEKWEAVLKGRGKVVHKVFVERNSRETVDLDIDIPEDVSDGNYEIAVQAIGERSGRDELRLEIVIDSGSAEQDELTAQYSELKGPSNATFKFRVDLTNNGIKDRSYSLGAAVPRGWQVSFFPSYKDQQIASLSVEAGKTEGLDVEVIPPTEIKEGEYIIPIQAVSADTKASAELKVIITGTYDLEMSTPSGRLSADIIAGEEKDITMEVENTGSAVLNGITFSSREPDGWSVKFDPDTVETLEPGEKRQVTATIKASNKAIAGDYVVSLSASTRETRDEADLRVTVETSTLWGVVGFIIILLVVAGVYTAFRTYGRR